VPTPKTQAFARYLPVSARDRRWGLAVTTVGESRIGQGQPYPPLRHPEGYAFAWKAGRVLKDYQIIYISRGGGQFESAASGKLTVHSGEMFILFPGVWHRYQPARETGWDEHWLGFDGPTVKTLMRAEFFPRAQPVIRIANEGLCRQLFTEAMEAVKTNQPALQQILAGVTAHLLGLIYSARQTGQVGGDQPLAVVQTAIQFMRTNLAANLDMPSLARQLHVSYSTFRHTFAAHTGMSPLQYLLELRMAFARNLLQETSLPLKDIAEKTGFEDEHYFSRLFRKRVGSAPGQWREKLRQEIKALR
jgi:AraC-like DNA-binding protein